MKKTIKDTVLPNVCRNCSATLNGHYCHNCGQENNARILPFSEVFWDILGEYITFDSKILHSLFPLIFRPGFLTNEYIAGKRVSYLLPSRMYLVIAVIFFFTATRFDPVTLSGNYNFNDQAISSVMKEKNLSQAEMEEKFNDGISSALGAFVLAMIPIFAGALKLLIPRRYFIEHLIFSFHFFSFMLISLIPSLFNAYIGYIALLYLFIYLAAAIRKVYFKSFLRTISTAAAIYLFLIFLIAFMFSVSLKYYVLSTI